MRYLYMEDWLIKLEGGVAKLSEEEIEQVHMHCTVYIVIAFFCALYIVMVLQYCVISFKIMSGDLHN